MTPAPESDHKTTTLAVCTGPVTADTAATGRSALPVTIVAGVMITALAFTVIRSVTDLWLPLDAAHFTAEAEWLRGNREILPGIHPPIFPSLIVVIETVVNRWDAALLAISLAYGCYVIAVFDLLRRWYPRGLSWLGAAVAGANPVLAEILGWGGGANLLGFAALIASVSSVERWIERGRGGLRVGLLVGVAGATHPLAGMLAVLVIGIRVLLGVRSGEIERGGRVGVRSVWGWVFVGFGGLPFAAVSVPYYFGVESPAQTSLGLPDLRVTFDLLGWSGREHPVFLFVNLAALVIPFISRGSRSRPAAVALSTVIIGMTSMIKGDVSYQSRAMYLLPVVVAIVFAELGPHVGRAVGSRFTNRGTRPNVLLALVVIVAIAQLGFLVRLDEAINYYERIERSDLAALERLRQGDGAIASSHWARSTSEPTNWFVSAGSDRPAISPMGPWLSTDRQERAAALDMQRFFAGQVVLESDAYQVAASGTQDGYYALQIGLRLKNWVYPVVVLDAARTRLPFPIVEAATSVDDGRLILSLRGPDRDVDLVEMTVEISGTTVVIAAEPDDRLEGNWHVVFATPPGASWRPEQRNSTAIGIDLSAGGERYRATLNLSTDVAARATTYGPGLPVDFDFVDPDTAEWRLSLDVTTSGRGLETFTEADFLDQYGITRVVVWDNTTLTQRFSSDCFVQTDAGQRITVFEVVDRRVCDG